MWNDRFGSPLTDTAQPFFSKSHQHVQAQITVSRLIEMLKAPHMDAILFQCIINTQKHQQRNGRHAAFLPFI